MVEATRVSATVVEPFLRSGLASKTMNVQTMVSEPSLRQAVSAEACDWGRLWTATADGSIQPEGKNPFPVELVSKRMGFQDFDVNLFCDLTAALRQAPLRAATNESTGLHVHVGRYPGFFSVEELGAILKAYLRFEPAINALLLPVTRQRNRFCRDFREVLGRAQGLGPAASDAALFEVIDRAVAMVKNLSPEVRAACVEGCRVTVTKGDLMLALLGEAGLWRLKRPLQAACEGRQLLLPAGTTLTELAARGRRLWWPPTCKDLQALWGEDGDVSPLNASEVPTPWTAMEALDDQDLVQCVFKKPEEVPEASVDHWLLRDALIMERHGARYCKLNIMRIAQASERATIEFRQFPGGDFNQPLLIWGWVKFLGLLVTHACACMGGVTGAELPKEASAEELKRFLQLSTDSLLLAWFRDLRNRLPKPEVALASMRSNWERLWSQWAQQAEQTTEADVISLQAGRLTAAGRRWRQIFQAASGMKAIFNASDPVWEPLSSRRATCEAFMQHLYRAILVRFERHVKLLSAAEEISRRCSLATLVSACVLDRRLRRSGAELRELQATVAETLGWEACDPQLGAAIAEKGRRGAELTVDYARNLLDHCEKAAQSFAHVGHGASGPGETQELERARTARAWASPALVWRTYYELCELLVPRVDEAVHVWTALAQRGWDTERVNSLWPRVWSCGQAAAFSLAAAWFASAKEKIRF